MKKLTLSLFMALLLAVVLQRCNQDDVTSQVEKIQFSVSISPTDANTGGRAKVALPSDVSVLLTLTTLSGDPIFTRRPVKIYTFGDSYITDPIELVPGSYKITEFLVVDQGNDVLFATPIKGSPMASAVSSPLPRSLTISKNHVANVDMQVLDALQGDPDDFGYAAFHIQAGSDLRIAVFADVNGETNLTNAKAFIINAANYLDTLTHYALSAKINNEFFGGDPDKEYILVVQKPHYKPYSLNFKFRELTDPTLRVFLQPRVLRLWYSPHTIPEDTQLARFGLILGADQETHIHVDFGNGTMKDYTIAAGHDVDTELIMDTGDYLIRITGELDNITKFEPYWEGQVKKVDFSDLINLRELGRNPLGFFGAPTVDLTYNYKLETADFGNFALDTVRLPYPAPLRALSIARSPNLSSDEISTIVRVLYANAVAKHINNGVFDNRAADGTMQGPPGTYELRDLRTLRDTYHWSIYPNPN